MSPHPPLSLWLVPAPADHAWLQARIDALAARHGAPRFEPHITLHVAPTPAGADLGALLQAATTLHGPLSLEALPTGHGPDRFKCLFLPFAAAALRPLHQALQAALPGDYAFAPHLSLLYQTLDAPSRASLARAEACAGRMIRFDHLAAVRPRPGAADWADVAGWQVVLRQPLTGTDPRPDVLE